MQPWCQRPSWVWLRLISLGSWIAIIGTKIWNSCTEQRLWADHSRPRSKMQCHDVWAEMSLFIYCIKDVINNMQDQLVSDSYILVLQYRIQRVSFIDGQETVLMLIHQYFRSQKHVWFPFVMHYFQTWVTFSILCRVDTLAKSGIQKNLLRDWKMHYWTMILPFHCACLWLNREMVWSFKREGKNIWSWWENCMIRQVKTFAFIRTPPFLW